MKPTIKLCLLGLPLLLASALPQQDYTFRILNLERRVDQLQGRLDVLERQQAMPSLNTGSIGSNNVALAQTELLTMMQRQQLALAQDLLTQQKQTLELRKALDQTTARLQELEKRQLAPEPAKPPTKTEEKPKPAAPRKP